MIKKLFSRIFDVFKIAVLGSISSVTALLELMIYVGVYFYFTYNAITQFLPSLDHFEKIERNFYVQVLDCKGNLLADYGDFYDQDVNLSNLPKYLIQALIDTEDRRFWQHNGIDWPGIARALVSNIKVGRINQGGSSITQQLSKNFLIYKQFFKIFDKSLQRKCYELVLSFLIEQKYSKQQILEFYLNRVYFGAGAIGISAASKRFFNKPATELNLYESARLVGMIQAPSIYSGNVEKGRARTQIVLENMRKANHLSIADQEIAQMLATDINKRQFSQVNYFADWIFQNLDRNKLAMYKKIIVHTTLDPDWQALAEKHVEQIFKHSAQAWKMETLSLIACDKDGAIRAFVGDADYNHSQFNALTALRQAGSLFKVLVYLTAFQEGLEPNDLIDDEPLDIYNWTPKNFSKKYKGEIALIDAFAQSINTIAVKLGMLLKPKKIIKMARKLGLTTHIESNLSIALGSNEICMLEMLAPFLTLLNKGHKTTIRAIDKISYQQKNNDDDNLDDNNLIIEHNLWEKTSSELILSEKVVNNMILALKECTANGTARRAKFDHELAAKTGTTQNHKDQWFIGMTAHCVVGIRGGTDKMGMDYQPSDPFHINLGREFMKELHERENWPKLPLINKEDDTENQEHQQENNAYNNEYQQEITKES